MIWRKTNKKQVLKTEVRQIQTGYKPALKTNTEMVFDQWGKKNTSDCGKVVISGSLKSPGWMLFQRCASVKHKFLGSVPGRKYKYSVPVMDRWADQMTSVSHLASDSGNLWAGPMQNLMMCTAMCCPKPPDSLPNYVPTSVSSSNIAQVGSWHGQKHLNYPSHWSCPEWGGYSAF